jgi:hypothetical protein
MPFGEFLMLSVFSHGYFVLQAKHMQMRRIQKMVTKQSRRPQRGRPPEPKETVRRNRVVTFLTDYELENLKQMADRNETTLSQACRHLIKKELE